MARKRKCSSVASTPQDSRKKVKVDTTTESDNNTGKRSLDLRRSTRCSNKKAIENDDAILNVNDTIPTEETKRSRKRNVLNGKQSKDSIDSAISDTTNESNDKTTDDESANDLMKKDVNLNENKDVDLDEKKDVDLNGKKDDELNLSDDESDDEEEQDESNARQTNLVNGDSTGEKESKSSSTKAANNRAQNSKKSSKQKVDRESSSDEEMNDQSDGGESSNAVLSGVRRSTRKRKSKFSFKELVSSDDEDSLFGEESAGRRSTGNSKRTKISKKEMKQTVDTFIGSDQDDYKPNESERSEDDEILEDVSDRECNDSDVSDPAPNTLKKSKYFNKGANKRSGVKVERNTIDLTKYSAPKSGGCTSNSIGIESLGNPQADLLKQKIANFKVPAVQSNQPQSIFGSAKCVKKLLQESHITKHYEKYKKGYIEQVKHSDKANKEDLMNILTKFETDVSENNQPTTSAAHSDDDSDDDFEEVENAEVGEDFDDYRPSCLKEGVTIEVKPTMKQRVKNKNEDWIYDAIRQSINRQRKEIYIDATKVDVLCNLARVRYLNELTFDPEMQALALSIDFYKNLKATSITESFVKKFVDRYKDTFKFNYSKDKSQLLTSRQAIRECFETKETNHPSIYNLVLLILFRTYCNQNSIEANSRLCIAFRPIDSKCDNLISKSKNEPKKTGDKKSTKEDDLMSDEEEKKPAKSTGKRKATSKKSKKKKDESDEDEDDGFCEPEAKSKSKKRRSTTVKQEEEAITDGALGLNKKNLIEIWSEIYVEDKKCEWDLKKKKGNKQPEKQMKSIDVRDWYCIEPISGVYTTSTEELAKKFCVSPLYVLSFDCKHYLKDLTPKYVTNFYLHKFKRLRLEDDWLDEVYSVYRPAEPTKTELDEDAKIKQFYLNKPLPKSQAEFKNHGLYVLERHLLKYEVIWPADAPVIGKFNQKEKIYLRENVHETHSKEYWKKEARQVKDGEEPIKISTARPKWDKNMGDWIRNLPLELFHRSQTKEWEVGQVVDGKVPRNEFGNVDLFKESMLPKGASYLRLNGLLRIAQKLNIDCVPAVTGFDLKCGGTIPLIDGFVVPQEYEEILTIAWNEEQVRLCRNAEEKYYKRVYGNWRRLIKGVLIHLDIKRKYRGTDE